MPVELQMALGGSVKIGSFGAAPAVGLGMGL